MDECWTASFTILKQNLSKNEFQSRRFCVVGSEQENQSLIGVFARFDRLVDPKVVIKQLFTLFCGTPATYQLNFGESEQGILKGEVSLYH
jgi:hypothetical protein